MLPDAGHVVHLNQKEMFNFRPFLGLDPESLATVGVQRLVADSKSGFPCRVSLQDAEVGESVLLMNYQHQSGPTPYRASHAIYVREWASWATPGRKAIPDLFRCRLFSLRALDASGMMVNADVAEGPHLETLIERMPTSSSLDYLQLHNAKPGYCAALVERA